MRLTSCETRAMAGKAVFILVEAGHLGSCQDNLVPRGSQPACILTHVALMSGATPVGTLPHVSLPGTPHGAPKHARSFAPSITNYHYLGSRQGRPTLIAPRTDLYVRGSRIRRLRRMYVRDS
jgi:hypothetical protein